MNSGRLQFMVALGRVEEGVGGGHDRATTTNDHQPTVPLRGGARGLCARA
jgi:hypothetical protein